jgi:hypothetical protein
MESSVKRMAIPSYGTVEESEKDSSTETEDQGFESRADGIRSIASGTRREAWRRMGEIQRRRRIERVRKSSG